jgi:hypothetical protein
MSKNVTAMDEIPENNGEGGVSVRGNVNKPVIININGNYT